jgi:deoxyribose-phosphate aldolase
MEFNLFEIISEKRIRSIIEDSGFSYDSDYSGDNRTDYSSVIIRSFSDNEIAAAIDHTLLKANATSEEIRNLCLEAKEYQFASVCVNPFYVPLSSKMLENTGVKVCTVIGFPLGANETQVKRFETEQAINSGADEIDMVINIGKLKDGDLNYLYRDISEVVVAAKVENRIIKVIIETCYLTEEEKIKACLLSAKAGADYVKTSTGFGTGGAIAADVALMKYLSGSKMRVKASGGIKLRKDAEIMLSMGADRLGTSSGVKIIKESRE